MNLEIGALFRGHELIHDHTVRHIHESEPRGVAAAAVLAVAVSAGVIASSNGSASAAPAPRRKVRREQRAFRHKHGAASFRFSSAFRIRNGVLFTTPSIRDTNR